MSLIIKANRRIPTASLAARGPANRRTIEYTAPKTPIIQSNIEDKNSIPILRPKRARTKPAIIRSTEEINHVEKAFPSGFFIVYTYPLCVDSKGENPQHMRFPEAPQIWGLHQQENVCTVAF
jgi:hypothetical protein